MSSELSVIGHRGWPSRFPDNTLPGFIAAATVCDGIELDVRRCADGKLVLAHDPTIGNIPVDSERWETLAEIDLGGGIKPCLLDEAMAALPDTPVFIEIKNQPGRPGYEPDSRLALEAASLARPSDAVISFNWNTVDAVRRDFPDVTTGLNLGLLGDLDDAIQQCLDGGHDLLVPEINVLKSATTPLPDHLKTYVWSTRRRESFVGSSSELASMGVSGIITDDPETMRDFLRSRQ